MVEDLVRARWEEEKLDWELELMSVIKIGYRDAASREVNGHINDYQCEINSAAKKIN